MVERYDIPPKDHVVYFIANSIRSFQIKLSKVPARWQWTLHNLVGHPMSEIAYQLGAYSLSDIFHNVTIPIRQDVDMSHYHRHSFNEKNC